MKSKLVKGMGLAIALSLMTSTLSPMTAHAALNAANVQYVPAQDAPAELMESLSKLTNASANTTMTATGSLVENPNSLDFTGINNTLNVQFNNLPVGEEYYNTKSFTYTATLENGYNIYIESSMLWTRQISISCYIPGASENTWSYCIESDADTTTWKYIWTGAYKEGENNDFANQYINPLLKCLSIIDTMKQAGATTDDITTALNNTLADADAYFSYGELDNFFNPTQYKIISSELWVGIEYMNDGYSCNYGYVFTPDTAEDTVPEVPVTPETPVIPETPVVTETPVTPETPVVTEIPMVPETPVVTETTTVAGDLVYTVKAGDTLGSISANYYGNNSKSAAIRTNNTEVFAANNGKLVVGMQLVLPEKIGNTTRIAEPTVSAGEVLYTVMHGDTLCKIAKAAYGTEKAFTDIMTRNNDRLSNANNLFPGQVIVLPAK